MPHWQVIGGYTHMDARYDVASGGSQGLDLSGWYPHDQFKLWNKVDFGQGTLKGLSLGGGVNYQSRTYAGTTGTNLLRTQYPYPATARAAHISGAVSFAYVVGASGRIIRAELVRSSGFGDIDEAAAALFDAARLPPPPDGHFRSTVTIRYALTER